MAHQTPLPRARRGRTTLVLGSVTAGLIAVGQGPASAAPADISTFCAAAPTASGFTDAGGIFAEEIACLEATGITTGVTPTTYAPAQAVTRGQMASFVTRLVDTAIALETQPLNGLPPAGDGGAFTDVPPGYAHHDAINRLAEAGIVQGGPGGLSGDQYGPTLPVSRAQIATMLAGAYIWLTGGEIAPPGDVFTDLAGLDPQLQDDIEALAEAGVTAGKTADTYAPFDPVTRGQMSAFLTRLLSVLQANGFIEPLPGEDAVFTTQLGELNGSGTTGTATVQVRGREATVTVTATGASAGLPHAQHIHIDAQGVCPPASADTDGNGFISTPEGVPFYGGIGASLTTEGGVGPDSGLAVPRFPVASESGMISYGRTFTLPEGVTAEDVAGGAIVVHGVADTTLGTDPATYDGPDSELMAGVPAEATLPAACGALDPAGDVQQLRTDLGDLNGSGTAGTATVLVDGDQVTVSVNATGASAGLPHAQHIHIGGENTCPAAGADTDGDGLVSVAEGAPSYGGIEVSLTTEGDVSAESALAVPRFPVASDSGVIAYGRTFTLPEGTTAEELVNGVIVSHGVADTTLGTDATAYDGPDSPLAAGVPQEATLPAACGPLS